MVSVELELVLSRDAKVHKPNFNMDAEPTDLFLIGEDFDIFLSFLEEDDQVQSTFQDKVEEVIIFFLFFFGLRLLSVITSVKLRGSAGQNSYARLCLDVIKQVEAYFEFFLLEIDIVERSSGQVSPSNQIC